MIPWANQFSVKHIFAATGRPKYMAVFVAYFDAAGDPKDPNIRVLSVAGWIATEAKWRRLERAWRRICLEAGVSGLHMNELAHFLGEYATWRDDEEKRANFLSDAVRTIHAHTNRDFSQSAYLDGYRAVDAQFEFSERMGHPYSLCALRCIQHVLAWMSRKHPNDDVLFVFEKGDAHQDEIALQLKRYEIDLGIEPIFMSKEIAKGLVSRTVPALECADFLAYEHHKTLTDVYVKNKEKARTSAWSLDGRGQHAGNRSRANKVFDGHFFEGAAHTMSIPLRPDPPLGPIPYELQLLAERLPKNIHRATGQDFDFNKLRKLAYRLPRLKNGV